MNTVTACTRLPALVDEMLMLVKESEDYQNIPDVKAVLIEARRILVSIRRRLVKSSQKYVVGVVGLTNVGKSTLLNALLGGEFAPRRNGPCTAVPIEFVFGETIEVTAHLKQSLHRPTWHCTSPDDIHLYLQKFADDGDEIENRKINRIVVNLPHPLLANGLVLSDTPGFGAAQVDDTSGSHEESLKAYLGGEISQVFWVVLADHGIGSREKLFQSTFSEICDDVVVTGCEDWDDIDRKRYKKRFVDKFGSRFYRFHFVSGLQGLQARKAKDESGLESAGITALETRIRELADPLGRGEAMRGQVQELTRDLGRWLDEYHDERGRSLRVWWRPDSWARFSALARSDSFAFELHKDLTQRQ